MCPPEHFAVEYAINPWMDTDDAGRRRTGRQAVGRPARDPGRPRPHGARAGPGAGPARHGVRGQRRVLGRRDRLRRPVPLRAAGRRGRRAPGLLRGRTGWRFVAPTRDQRGRGRLRLPARGARRPGARRVRLPHRAGRARRGAGGARPPGARRCAWSTRASTTSTSRWPRSTTTPSPTTRARSPRPRSGCCAQLFPDAVIADEADALAFGLNLVSDGRHVVLNSEATGLAGQARARPGTSRCRSSWAS